MRRVFLLASLIWLLSVVMPVAAQDGGDDACKAQFSTAVEAVIGNCAGTQTGTICWGSGSAAITMASGQSVSSMGGSALLKGLASVAIQPGDAWGITVAYLPDMIKADQFATLVLFGEASLEQQEDAQLPPGAAFSLTTGPESAPCSELAQPGLLVQAPAGSLTLLRVNDVNIAVNGVAVIHAPEGKPMTVVSLARETILSDSGTVIFAGYSAQVPDDAAQVIPYDPALVAHVPVDVLPTPEVIPVPGNATVREQVNLHLRPNPSAYTGTVVKAGLPVNVLGQNTEGDWLHIRTYDGEIGWVPLSALAVNLPVAPPVYDEAPAKPPREFGPVQATGVTTAEASNLRDGPGQGYAIVTTVPLSTPVDIYARSADGTWLMIELPDATRAWISADLITPTTPRFSLDELPLSPDFPG